MRKRVLSVLLALTLMTVPLCVTAHAATGASISNFTVSLPLGTINYQFTIEDFQSHYTGTRTMPLTDIMINSVPAEGRLRYGGADLTGATVPKIIPVSSINMLTYVAPTGMLLAGTTISYNAYSNKELVGNTDGGVAPATITIKVTNNPVAKDLVFETGINKPLTAKLEGTDPQNRGTVTYTVTTPPAAGQGTVKTPAGADITDKPADFVFTPATNFIGIATFEYTVSAATGETSDPAIVRIYVGGRPTASDMTVTVLKDSTDNEIKLKVVDSMGRPITFFDVGKNPTKGDITAFDQATGIIKYTPDKGFEGTDSFTFYGSLTDINSNEIKSNEATVTINVAKYAITPVEYADMLDHWAAYSAGSLGALDIVKGERIYYSTTGTFEGATETKRYFRPDEQITRGEFVLWLVSAMRIKPDTSTVSVFSDKVPSWMVGATNAAYHANIVLGTLVGGQRFLKANDTLTRLEAIVMIDRAMKLSTSSATPDFKDWHAVPTWGQQAVMNLAGYGIVKGTPSGYLFPHEMLTRAETAELLFQSYKLAILETR